MLKGLWGLIVVVLASSCTKTEPPPVPPQIGPNTRADVVGSLKQAGIETKAPTTFLFFLKFDDRDAASRAASALQSFCQRTEVVRSEGATWNCRARKTLVPDSDQTEAMLAQCKQTAADLGGSFEGWETDFGR